MTAEKTTDLSRVIQTARKWLAIGAGIGIEIGERDLNVCVVRVRPTGTRVLGALTIHKFREQPAAEWGAVYSNFLTKLGVAHLAAIAVLQRKDVIVRPVALPGVAKKDVESALLYQLDSLHPYAEQEAVAGWTRIGRTESILVGIARRDVFEYYTTLFAEAGVKLAALSFSAGVMQGALRLLAAPPAEGFLALQDSGDGQFEAYGESVPRGIFSALIHAPAVRAGSMALSELRLEPDTPVGEFSGLLPVPEAIPEDFDLSRSAVQYAAALAGACPRLAQPLNLLPADQRQGGSRALFIPTIVLASIVLLLLAALGISGMLERRRYMAELQNQIHTYERQALSVRAVERKIDESRVRIKLLEGFRAHSKDDLDALSDLTKLLAPPTWLRSMDLNRTQADIFGDTDQAAALLKTLDHSPLFGNSEFAMPLTRSGAFETFRIRSQRKGTGGK